MEDRQIESVPFVEEDFTQLKRWLFNENIRLQNLNKEVEDKRIRFDLEKEQFMQEMRLQHRKLEFEKKRILELDQMNLKKQEILESAFRQLDLDRKKVEKERHKVDAELRYYRRENQERHSYTYQAEDMPLLFCGVHNELALKKRYKDLIKIYHPDNATGDKGALQFINREYDRLRIKFGREREA